MDQHLAEVVKEIEDEQALGKISAVEVFKGMLNQPELVSVSSANAQQIGPSYAYSNFTVNMPRPILEAETLQLLAANIPLCTQNFPDTACAFWYYRLDEYAGTVPNTENLFMVRLLPSYYKPEFIGTSYGYNVTFDSYQSVAVQLAKSCTTDLTYNNIKSAIADGEITPDLFQYPFVPSDISITYDSTQNKFQMTGQNTAMPLFAYSAADTYAGATTYASGDFVSYDGIVYRSLQSSNLNHTPSTSPTWWAFVTNRLVQDWVQYTAYRAGQYIYASSQILQTTTDFYASTPSFVDGDNWVAPSAPNNYNYLVTGFADPNVVVSQGGQGYAGVYDHKQWNPYALYEIDSIVRFEGRDYKALKQNKNWTPFNISTSTIWSGTTLYKVGDVVRPSAPLGLGYPPYWKCIRDTIGSTINADPFLCSTYWIPCYWVYAGSTEYPPAVGLHSITSQMDMLDYVTVLGTQYLVFPFPYDIPGQPFNPAPRRLLNSLLGFCWNGIFNVTAVDQTFNGVTAPFLNTSGEVVDLLNRIRPVPIYDTRARAAITGLHSAQASTTSTYTADGYANLVYSSIVAIYSTIVYGSTLDSQRSTNLIGLSSLNAGNLGVSFFDNKINTPLRVKGTDIYSIGIEIRDEMNEPYPLWNSAVSTFTLKLTYKENRAEK